MLCVDRASFLIFFTIIADNNCPSSLFSFFAVEFPAVLLNTSTGEVESEFHTYVQPQEHPILSEFCTELTGITQVSLYRHKYTATNIPLHFLVYCTQFYIYLLSDSFIYLSHRCKLKQGSPFRSVFRGSTAGCKTCSSRWVWSFPTNNRDLPHLHLLRNCVLSSHGQVKVNCIGSQFFTMGFCLSEDLFCIGGKSTLKSNYNSSHFLQTLQRHLNKNTELSGKAALPQQHSLFSPCWNFYIFGDSQLKHIVNFIVPPSAFAYQTGILEFVCSTSVNANNSINLMCSTAGQT